MDWTLLLISALIFATIGYVAGGLVSTLRNKDTTEANQSLERMEKPVEIAHSKPKENKPAPFLGVYRDQKKDILRIEMDGKPVVASNALTPDLMTELRRFHTDLKAWMGEPVPISAVEPSEPVRMSVPGVTHSNAPAVRQTGPLSARLVNAVSPPVSLEPEVVAPLSMVAQIDEILQKLIAGTDLEKRGVKLLENPTHGVEVWVGAFRYEGVDQVPEDDVKKAIRTAVKMWESRRVIA